MESELFGHAPGAYPNALEGKKGFFEQANGGSVLLDEIGEMSPRMQTKLLRFLNDGTFRRVGEEHEVHVDVRVICATQKNLTELVQRGEFREDLYYRLNVLTITIPPLRERPQDIMPLTELFVARFADEQGVARPAGERSGRLPQQVRLAGQRAPAEKRHLPRADANRRLRATAAGYRVAGVRGGDVAGRRGAGRLAGRHQQAFRALGADAPVSHLSQHPQAGEAPGVSHTAIANKLREYGLSSRKGGAEGEE